MDYDTYFTATLRQLQDERRYRVFADLERIAGRFPYASAIQRKVGLKSLSGAQTTILEWDSTRR